MFFPALIAKLLSAGAIAQAATGAGVAVVVVASAGAAGVLPGPVQETFSSIVGTDSAETSDPATVGTTPTTEPADPTDIGSTPTDAADQTETPATESPEVTGPDPSQPFGEWLNGRVEHGEVDGKRVSEWAHERNEQRRDGGADDADQTPEAGDDTGSAEDDGQDDGQEDATVQSGADHRGAGKGGHGDR